MAVKILYVEDEPSLGRIVSETMEQQGFCIRLVADGAQVLPALTAFQPDVCVLDIMLPNIDGYTLCREIRSQYQQMPILFLTARTETSDLVKGFESGGTDYIKKPFSMEELIVRIKNQMQITANRTSFKNEDLVFGKYRLSLQRYELKSPSQTHKLSSREMELLVMLTSEYNKIIERKEILLSIWGDDSFFNSRTLDVYIRKLRSLLSEDPDIELVTLKGKGYLFLVKS